MDEVKFQSVSPARARLPREAAPSWRREQQLQVKVLSN